MSKDLYKQSGVDINKGNDLVEKIKPYAKATTRTEVLGGLGGFGGMFDISKLKHKEPVLVAGADGVGTKLRLAIQMNSHAGVGIDLVAMCVNDLLVQGAEPLFFLDYYACESLDPQIASEVIRGIAIGCKQADCALLGGETAEMPSMYRQGDYDVAGFAVGVAEKKKLLPKMVRMKEDNLIIGLPSSGLHSNGFSLVRFIMQEQLHRGEPNFKYRVGEDIVEPKDFLTPTKIYAQECARLKDVALGFCHITGGGLTENLPRILPDGLDAQIDLASWQLPAIFKLLQQKGEVEQEEMLKVFNCGIGMCAIISKSNLRKIKAPHFVIGKLVAGAGKVVYKNNLNYG